MPHTLFLGKNHGSFISQRTAMGNSCCSSLCHLLGCPSTLSRPLQPHTSMPQTIRASHAFPAPQGCNAPPSLGISLRPLPLLGSPRSSNFLVWQKEKHTKGPASPFYADHRGENQMIACSLQARGSLLGGYSSWDERSILLDKEKRLSFLLFFFFRAALCAVLELFLSPSPPS